MFYRIKNWSTTYENAQSRKHSNLAWVPVPNKHDGRRFREVSMLDPSGGTFAAFILMVEIASKCKHRGDLVDSDGTGLTPFDLQLMTGYPETMFENAIKILSNQRIGWIEMVEQYQSDGSAVVSDYQRGVPEQNRTEQNRTEENGTERNVPSPTPPASATIGNYAGLTALCLDPTFDPDSLPPDALAAALIDLFKQRYQDTHSGTAYIVGKWDEKTLRDLVTLNKYKPVHDAIMEYYRIDRKHTVKEFDQHISDGFERLKRGNDRPGKHKPATGNNFSEAMLNELRQLEKTT
jgi:hypothetical protein